jgi:hypothetical protein
MSQRAVLKFDGAALSCDQIICWMMSDEQIVRFVFNRDFEVPVLSTLKIPTTSPPEPLAQQPRRLLCERNITGAELPAMPLVAMPPSAVTPTAPMPVIHLRHIALMDAGRKRRDGSSLYRRSSQSHRCDR